MYQFYYAAKPVTRPSPEWKLNMHDRFRITAIRPATWEEHCLECSAPVCFQSCVHFTARSDGRCQRFDNGFAVYENSTGCCRQGAYIKYRRWGTMMTILFPAMLPVEDYLAMQQGFVWKGRVIRMLTRAPLPRKLRFLGIRTIEFLRRRKLRRHRQEDIIPDAFLFHGYSHEEAPFRLMLEILDDHTSVYKTALELQPGENLYILDRKDLSSACWTAGYVVKVYPENNLEAGLDILWCDFVQGQRLSPEEPAPTVKCVVWDLDNTLWNGTLVETGDPDTLALNPQVQETVRELDARGVIQSIASKNDFDAAWAQVERLGLGAYFLYPQIHWNAKSGSIQHIAARLNLGADAFALIDDSPFEREQVRDSLPQVRCYDPSVLPELLSLPEFQLPVTRESRARREMYRAEEQRTRLQQSGSDDTVAFLRKCALEMTLFAAGAQPDRCYELISRTNQLNMTGRKYTRQEFDALLTRPGHKNIAFSCADTFGAYGTIGFAQYRAEEGTLTFTEFAMSCRVAGKYVESAFFSHLLEKEGCTEGFFPVVKTKKNTLLRSTLAGIGFQAHQDRPESVDFRFGRDLKCSDLVRCLEG